MVGEFLTAATAASFITEARPNVLLTGEGTSGTAIVPSGTALHERLKAGRSQAHFWVLSSFCAAGCAATPAGGACGEDRAHQLGAAFAASGERAGVHEGGREGVAERLVPPSRHHQIERSVLTGGAGWVMIVANVLYISVGRACWSTWVGDDGPSRVEGVLVPPHEPDLTRRWRTAGLRVTGHACHRLRKAASAWI